MKGQKPKVSVCGTSSVPWKNTAPKVPKTSSEVSNYVTLSHIYIIYDYIDCRSEANWKLKTGHSLDTVSSVESGVCKLTNQSPLGYIGGGS